MNCSILAAARQVASIRHGGGGARVCNGMIGTRKRNHSTQQVKVGFYDDGRTKLEACLEHFHKEGSFGERITFSPFATSLKDDLKSDNDLELFDDYTKNQLSELSPSNYDAQQIRSKLPPQLNLCSLTSLFPNETIKRKLPPMMDEEDVDELSADDYGQPLPNSTNYQLDEDERAIVITETKNPFRIVAVNTAWENLCGYNREECKGVSVGRLLQGPKTDMAKATAMLSKLSIGEEADTTMINYTKDGLEFQNNIRVGPVINEMGKTVNFIGILREVKDNDESFSTVRVVDKMKKHLPFAA